MIQIGLKNATLSYFESKSVKDKLFKVSNFDVINKKIIIYKNLSIEFNEGDIVCLYGPKKSGKTSFLKALGGVMPLEKGTRYFTGNVNAIFRNNAVIIHNATVLENIYLNYYKQKIYKTSKSFINAVLDKNKILLKANVLDKAFKSLDNEQKNIFMMTLNKALLVPSDILIIDDWSLGEPDSELDDIVNRSGIVIFSASSKSINKRYNCKRLYIEKKELILK